MSVFASRFVVCLVVVVVALFTIACAHSKPQEEIAEYLKGAANSEMAVAQLSLEAIQNLLGDRIKHIVVLMEENRSFDHLLGWFGNGVNGLNGTEYNLVNVTNPNSTKVFVSKDAPYINYCDPNHGTPQTAYKAFGPEKYAVHNYTEPPCMCGFVEFELLYDTPHIQYCGVMDMFDTKKKLPVFTKLAEEFGVMDRFFASIPGPTWPNRQMFMSATSMGLTETFFWYQNVTGQLYPQKTIFDQVGERNASWAVYYEDTPWEMFLESLAFQPEHLHSLDQFFEDARTGNLPAFSFLNPRSGINITTGEMSNDEHPDHDVALAEAHYRRIYEALRNGAAWNDTLFVLTFDEHGGFYDHVPTPLNVPPPAPNGTEPSYPDYFSFDRLGVRIPTLLISPWIQKGRVISEPPAAQKPYNNSEYDLTSIMASARKILTPLHGLPPLTQRDAWVATWEHVLLELNEPRTDCPTTLPLPPPPSIPPEEEAARPVNNLQSEVISFHANLAGEPYPDHLKAQGQISEWMQSKFHAHRERTARWKHSKKQGHRAILRRHQQPEEQQQQEQAQAGHDHHFSRNTTTSVEMHPMNLNSPKGSYPVQPDETQQWLLQQCLNETTQQPCTEVDPAEIKMTFSLLLNGTAYCLDGRRMKENSTVGASECYPTANPYYNKDKDQQWTLHQDATLRLYGDESLCVTNRYFVTEEQDVALTLEDCEPGNVRQHYAYHGHGANAIPGLLLFGDGLTAITILPPNQEQ